MAGTPFFLENCGKISPESKKKVAKEPDKTTAQIQQFKPRAQLMTFQCRRLLLSVLASSIHTTFADTHVLKEREMQMIQKRLCNPS